MTDITPPTPNELAQIIKSLGLSSREFGEAIGYSDAERITRALVRGERHQKAYAMSGTAARALGYMRALTDLVAAHAAFRVDQTPENEDALVKALEAGAALLPARLQPKDLGR